jgi:hypothetical protein
MWILLVAAGCVATACASPGDGRLAQDERGAGSERRDAASSAFEPAAADASPYVVGFGDLSVVSLPAGDPGVVAIIDAAETIDRTGSVTVIVRNNTSSAVGLIEIAGTARDETGMLVGSGSSQSLQPVVVEPGEIAYGYVYFDTRIPDGTAYEFSFDVATQPAWEFFRPVTITELNHTGTKIVGTVMNDLDDDVSGPISADVICFDDSGRVEDRVQSYIEQGRLAPGATGSFEINLRNRSCSNGLAAVSGYGF